MKSMATSQDLQLKARILPYTSARDIPLTFCCEGRTFRGIPEDFSVSVTRRAISADITLYDILAVNTTGLQIRVEYREYADHAVTEWLASFTNTGTEPTGILSQIGLGGVLPVQVHTLCHSNGDTHEMGAFQWYTDPLDRPFSITPIDGTACKGAFPYMRLLGQDMGVNLAIGWSGKWRAELTPEESGIRVWAGQDRCHLRILPGETIRTPRLTLMAYAGQESRGRNLWRRWYLKYILPRENGQPLPPVCCMHLYHEGGKEEWTGATEAGQLQAIDRYLAGGIRPDVYWVDAGWYPCNGSWRNLGDWRADPDRFPNGLSPIGQKCAEENIRFLLWFEPERVMKNSAYAQAHPEWMLDAQVEEPRLMEHFLVNLGDPHCCDQIIEMVDGYIKQFGVRVYRQDFNFDPLPRWIQNEAADRVGALENLHIQGYYRFWDALLEKNPGLWIDSCASGGRRNDLETMRRSVPLHYTDVGYGIHPTKQLQHRLMFEWIPYFRAHVWSWDDPDTGEYIPRGKYTRRNDEYAFYAALTPALTDMLRWDADEALYDLSKKMQPIWRKAAGLMLRCDYYPLTECRESQEDFYAMAFYDPDTGEGFLNVVSNNRNPETQFTAVLDMLEADAVYTLTEAETGTEVRRTGRELATGFPVTLQPRSGVVYFLIRES